MNRIDFKDCLGNAGAESLDFRKSLSILKSDVERLIDIVSGENVPRRASPFDSVDNSTRKMEPDFLGSTPVSVPFPEAGNRMSPDSPDLSGKGSTTVVGDTIVVDGGVFDGKGATFTASSALGDGGQSEAQRPVFILKNGATLKNVDLGENGADGIHVYNGATLQNVNWTNVGEDALTVKSPGDVFVEGGSARGASDKIFQVNADTNFHISDFTADGFQTFIRTNGGKEIDAQVTIDGGNFANGTTLFRTDSSSANVQFLSDIVTNNVENSVRNRNDITQI